MLLIHTPSFTVTRPFGECVLYTKLRRSVDYRECSDVDAANGRYSSYPQPSPRLVCGEGRAGKLAAELTGSRASGTTGALQPRFFDFPLILCSDQPKVLSVSDSKIMVIILNCSTVHK